MVNPTSNNTISKADSHQAPNGRNQQVSPSTSDNASVIAHDRLRAPTSLIPATCLAGRAVTDNVSEDSSQITRVFPISVETIDKSKDQVLKSLGLFGKQFRTIKDLNESEAIIQLKEALSLFNQIKNNHVVSSTVGSLTKAHDLLTGKHGADNLDSCSFQDQMEVEKTLDDFRFALALGLSEYKDGQGLGIRSFLEGVELPSDLSNIVELSDCLAGFFKDVSLFRDNALEGFSMIDISTLCDSEDEDNPINEIFVTCILTNLIKLVDQKKTSLAFDLIVALSIDKFYSEKIQLSFQEINSSIFGNEDSEIDEDSSDESVGVLDSNKTLDKSNIVFQVFTGLASKITNESDFIYAFQSAMVFLRRGDAISLISLMDIYPDFKSDEYVLGCATKITHPFFFDKFLLCMAGTLLIQKGDVTRTIELLEYVKDLKLSEKERDYYSQAYIEYTDEDQNIFNNDEFLLACRSSFFKDSLSELFMLGKYSLGLAFGVALKQPEVKSEFIETFSLALAVEGYYDAAIEGVGYIQCDETQSRVLEQVNEEKHRMEVYKKICGLISNGKVDEAGKLCSQELLNLSKLYGKNGDPSHYIMRIRNHLMQSFPEQIKSSGELIVSNSDLAILMASQGELEVHSILNSKTRANLFEKKYKKTIIQIGNNFFQNKTDVYSDETLLKLSCRSQEILDKYVSDVSIPPPAELKILLAFGAELHQGKYEGDSIKELEIAIFGDLLGSLNVMMEWLKVKFEKSLEKNEHSCHIYNLSRAMIYAVQYGRKDSLKILINTLLSKPFNKVSANKLLDTLFFPRDTRGWPILLVAVENREVDIVEMLIDVALNHPAFKDVDPIIKIESLFYRSARGENALEYAMGYASSNNTDFMRIVRVFIKACSSEMLSQISKSELFSYFLVNRGITCALYHENISLLSDCITLLTSQVFDSLDLNQKMDIYSKQDQKACVSIMTGYVKFKRSCLSFAAKHGRIDLLQKMADSVITDTTVDITLSEKVHLFINLISVEDVRIMKDKGFDIIEYLDRKTI